jgi:hypothetical protein
MSATAEPLTFACVMVASVVAAPLMIPVVTAVVGKLINVD